MMGPSVRVKNKRLYQIYCGRLERANIVDDEGKVLDQMSKFDWVSFKNKMKLDTIYLLGLWDVTGSVVVNYEEGIDLTQVKLRIPSAFAITDHTRVWPKLGTNDDLEGLINKIHQAGLQVIVDFVANHTGLDHPWIRSNPDFYKHRGQELAEAAFSGDVLELNYKNPKVWIEMIKAGIKLADIGADGFRCDMAHLVPDSFWKQMIEILKKINPDFYMLAESYGQDLFDQNNRLNLLSVGFDSVYDSGLYQNLKSLEAGGELNNLVAHVNYVNMTDKNQWTHYISNHDDSFPINYNKIKPSLSLIATLPGEMLIYNGIESGFGRRLGHHFVDILKDDLIYQPVDQKLADWLNYWSRDGLVVKTYEAMDNDYIRAEFESPQSKGWILINFTDKTVIDELCQTTVEAYESKMVVR